MKTYKRHTKNHTKNVQKYIQKMYKKCTNTNTNTKTITHTNTNICTKNHVSDQREKTLGTDLHECKNYVFKTTNGLI